MLLLLLNYVVLRALWKIDVHLVSTLLIKSLLLILFYFIDFIPPNIVLTYVITVVDTNSFDVSVCPSYLFIFVFFTFQSANTQAYGFIFIHVGILFFYLHKDLF